MTDKITYEEFLELAKPHAGGRFHAGMYDDNLEKLIDNAEVFYQEWVIGGQGGGNVWNDHHYSLSAEKEPDLEGLYEVFEKLDISYWKGRKIEREVQAGTYIDRGYYGDETNYAYKWIKLDIVYDMLAEFGLAYPREQAPRPGK